MHPVIAVDFPTVVCLVLAVLSPCHGCGVGRIWLYFLVSSLLQTDFAVVGGMIAQFVVTCVHICTLCTHTGTHVLDRDLEKYNFVDCPYPEWELCESLLCIRYVVCICTFIHFLFL